MTNLASLLPSPPLLTDPAAVSATSPRAGGARAKADVAVQFESLFISQLLKEMRQTEQGGGLFAGESSDTYGGIFDLYLGEHLAKSGGLGLARMINAYLETSKSS
jgi:flagellar protein FlgJ